MKLVIPFIRIAHLPHSHYSQVKGDLIMISSQIERGLEKIIPMKQSLLPVAFKRKLQYRGHYIAEVVDREKLLAYFLWFRQNNPLFAEYNFDKKLLNKFLQDLNGQDEQDKNSEEDEDNEEEDDDLTPEKSGFESCSIIMDKYKEDPTFQSASTRMADLIVQFEKDSAVDECCGLAADPEDEFFKEDEEHEEAPVQPDDNPHPTLDTSDFSEEDLEAYEKMLSELKGIDYHLMGWDKACKCVNTRYHSRVIDAMHELKKISTDQVTLKTMIANHLSKLQNLKDSLWEKRDSVEPCSKESGVVSLFRNVLNMSNRPDLLKSYFLKKSNTAMENARKKICIAPAEEGQWKNWLDDVFLEEKCYPNLFPYGMGGYLSSNYLRNTDVGFANYVKSRLLSADDKFRKDKTYVFFLLLVKEMVELKRSEQIYFRKATKASNLTPESLQNVAPELLMRYNNAYGAFKTIRGTSAYFQDIKKKLNAFIRQKGAPTLFCSFSCAEFSWNETIHQIYESVNKTQVPLDFIKSKDSAWKTKFVAENEIQSTIHFSKRTSKLMAILSNQTHSPFHHNGKKFFVAHHFVRVEFQVQLTL